MPVFRCLILVFLLATNISCGNGEQQLEQGYVVIDGDGAGRCAIGDIDGDGFNDIAVHRWGAKRGLVADGSLDWYRYPDWSRTTIKHNANFFGDEIRIADIDGDGDNDVVTCAGNDTAAALWCFRNPGGATQTWEEFHIGTASRTSEVKDIEVADIDRDDNLDVVVRTKSKLVIFFQDDPDTWSAKPIPIRLREGMALGDMDGDGDTDAVVNGTWLENPDDPRNADWHAHIIDRQWFSDDTGRWRDFSVMVAVNDINNDGRLDVVYSHSEKPSFNVTWYTSADPRGGEAGWTKHPLGVVDYCHTLGAEDYDLDGDIDIIAGTSRWAEKPRVVLWVNEGDGSRWSTRTISARSVYKGKLGDIDNDGDIDLVSSSSWEDPPVQLWRNPSASFARLGGWQRHLVDGDLPDNAVFVLHGDINGDGSIDIVAGAWWWSTSAALSGPWERHRIGAPLHNAALVHDFDHDGVLDVLGTTGIGAGQSNHFVWGRNDGAGRFEILDNIGSGGSGDFLQGICVDDFGIGEQVALSWHNGGGGVQSLSIPDQPSTVAWPHDKFSEVTLKEALSVGDIDRDGDQDLLLGTVWLRNDGVGWTPLTLGGVDDLEAGAQADRNRLVDVNSDGRLDAVIGLEDGTYLLWFEAPEDPAGRWERHIVGTSEGGGFSMDTADLDSDGDPDIVVGEHRGEKENRVLLFENIGAGTAWQRIVIDSDSKENIDHHDGTRFVDLDRDGDLDIVSLGWYNKKVWVYENLSITSKPGGDAQ